MTGRSVHRQEMRGIRRSRASPPISPILGHPTRAVIRPWQVQRHILVALKLPVDVSPVRFRPGNPRRR